MTKNTKEISKKKSNTKTNGSPTGQTNWVEERKRLLAEIDNLQKQKQHELLDYYKFRNQDLITDLLEVIDALNHSLAFKESSEETKKFLQGIQMTTDRFSQILKNFGVKKIKVKIGDQYNPGLHQTLDARWEKKHPEGTILGVGQDGYLLHDRVLRTSKVVINQKAKQEKK